MYEVFKVIYELIKALGIICLIFKILELAQAYNLDVPGSILAILIIVFCIWFPYKYEKD